MPLSRSELITGDLYTLVTLTARGKDYRFSSRDVAVTNANDESLPATLHFIGGLEPTEYEDAIELGDSMPPERSSSVTVLFHDDDGDGWETIANADHDLGDATCELAIWKLGDDWRDRRVLLAGAVVSPEYGASYEPVSFSVSEEPSEDTGLIPLDRETVTDDRFPILHSNPTVMKIADSAAGQMYPTIYGAPGVITAADAFTELPAVPGLLVEIDETYETNSHSSAEPAFILVAGHHVEVTGNTVAVYNVTQGLSANLTVIDGSDDEKHPLSYIEVEGGDLTIDIGDEIYLAFRDLTLGGMRNLEDGGTMRNAVDIILDLLGRSTLRYDAFRIRALAHVLGGFNLDFYTNEQRSPWDVIQDEILPLLPLAPAIGPNGLYFVHWPFGATSSDAVGGINPASWGGARDGPVRVSDAGDVVNQLRIGFALNVESGEYSRSLTLGPRAFYDGDDTNVHPLAYQSYTRYGLRAGDVIETDVVYDSATAYSVLDWKIKRDGMTYREVEYLLPQTYQYLEPGNVVLVTDDDIAWTDRVCLVTSIIRRPGDTVANLRTIPNWIRDAPP